MSSSFDRIKENIFSRYKKESWELKSLRDIALEIVAGNDVRKDQIGSGDFPAIRYKDIHDSKTYIKKCINFVDPKIIRNVKYVEKGYLLIAKVSENEEGSGKSCSYLGEEKAIIGGGTIAIKHSQNPGFLSYACSSEFVKKQFQNNSRPGIVVNFPQSSLSKVKIPLPFVEIQNEITDLLDKFSVLEQELERELERELENRKKQYEYYKNLIFDRGIDELNWELKTLEEVTTEIISGNEVIKTQLNTGDFPAVKCGDINSSLPQQFDKCISFVDQNIIKRPKYFEKGNILISNMGGENSVGKSCVYLGKKKCLAGDHVVIIKSNQNTKYLNYALSTEYTKSQIKGLMQIGIVYELHKSKMKQIKIPLPSLEEQAKVVEILDKLYAITNDIKEGIPSLIRKNKEQYNFYKESLISPE